MGITIIIASLLANLITKFAKPEKLEFLSEEQRGERKVIIRVLNAVAGIVMAVCSYMLLGVELDVTQVQTYIEIIITGILTFGASQGWYFLSK